MIVQNENIFTTVSGDGSGGVDGGKEEGRAGGMIIICFCLALYTGQGWGGQGIG